MALAWMVVVEDKPCFADTYTNALAIYADAESNGFVSNGPYCMTDQETCCMCNGSGQHWTECCSGYKCSCGGQLIMIGACPGCNGTGFAPQEVAEAGMRAHTQQALASGVTHWGNYTGGGF
jgi:hypothetical protein